MFKLVRDPWFLILNYKISFHSTTKFNDPRFLNERFQKVFKYLMDVFQAKVTENTVPKQCIVYFPRNLQNICAHIFVS